MNKTKKGFLNAASILTIIAASLGILMSCLLFLGGKVCDENMVKEVYKRTREYDYYEQADGSYYFVKLDSSGLEIRITESEVEVLAKFVSRTLYGIGFFQVAMSLAKLILAIRILAYSNRQKYSLGCVIALIVLNILSMSLLESAFLVTTLCLKDKKSNNPNGMQEFNKNQ